jgi:hypothetical protein
MGDPQGDKISLVGAKKCQEDREQVVWLPSAWSKHGSTGNSVGNAGDLYLEDPKSLGVFYEFKARASKEEVFHIRVHRAIEQKGTGNARTVLLRNKMTGVWNVLRPGRGEYAGRDAAAPDLKVSHTPWNNGSAGGWCDAEHKCLWGRYEIFVQRGCIQQFNPDVSAPPVQDIGTDIQIHCINLDSRTDRWQALSSQMSLATCPVERFSGILVPQDVNQLAVFLQEHSAPPLAKKVLKWSWRRQRGCIGCYLSHLLLHRAACVHPSPPLYSIVLEDDISFAAPFAQLLADVILPFINTFWIDWDCVRFDCTPVVEMDQVRWSWLLINCLGFLELLTMLSTWYPQIAVFLGAPVYRVSKMRKKGNYFGTHFCLYRNDRRSRILQHLESQELNDSDMAMAKNAQGLNSLVFNPGICRQNRKLPSDNVHVPKPRRKVEPAPDTAAEG